MLRKGRGPTKEAFKQVIPGGPTYSLGDCVDQRPDLTGWEFLGASSSTCLRGCPSQEPFGRVADPVCTTLWWTQHARRGSLSQLIVAIPGGGYAECAVNM